MHPDAQRVFAFWFNRNPTEWIIAPAGLDDQLKRDFGQLVLQARKNELDDWAAEPETSLALVTLLDQFPRNLFRGTADAFTSDKKASEVAANAIALGFDKQVTVMQASAFYLPLMQQENLTSVIAARGLFQNLKPRCAVEKEHEWVDMGIAASKRHLTQLQRFGRYPTRNAILGRHNTEAEEEFLKDHTPSL